MEIFFDRQTSAASTDWALSRLTDTLPVVPACKPWQNLPGFPGCIITRSCIE